ncbi:MAG: RdgB/HAM1 family non-canonical purine NTP pyrophosphatase [Saccharofermentanales bacterium]|jgi:XTP/dITP diphosphohydrolase
MRIVVATHNAHKLAEMRAIVSGTAVELIGLREVGFDRAIEETGTTFDANATLKALTVHDAVGGWVLADDSGLEVAALDGRPGVMTARFAGPDATDDENVRHLLDVMLEVPRELRGARFMCAMALVDGARRVTLHHGVLNGAIAEAPRGRHGFGYDPIFVPEGMSHTLAELSADTKNRMSHRSRALMRVLAHLARDVG